MTEAMDVFSVGCVVAEVFNEGRGMFSLAQMYKYRAGEIGVEGSLAGIEDEGIRVRVLLFPHEPLS